MTILSKRGNTVFNYAKDRKKINNNRIMKAFTKKSSIKFPLTYKDVEPWERIPYIETGYRQCKTYKDCIKIMFTKIHNDSFNAWSMIIFMLTSMTVTQNILSKYSDMSYLDASPFIVLCLSQIVHCPVSWGFHSFRVISKETLRKWRDADISLIMIVNVCCTYAASYFTLCSSNTIFNVLISMSFALSGIYDILRKDTSSRDLSDKSRIISRFFLSGAPYYLIVIVRAFIDKDPSYALKLISFHSIGGYCYFAHWPQIQFPRKFDLFGGSHNLMHLLCCSSNILGIYYLEELYCRQNTWVRL